MPPGTIAADVSPGGDERAPLTVAIAGLSTSVSRALSGCLAEAGIYALDASVEETTLAALLDRLRPGVLILGEQIGYAALGRLRAGVPQMGILLLATVPTDLFGGLALGAGVSCVNVRVSERELIAALRATARGRHVFIAAPEPLRRARLLARALTRRESEVLELLELGCSHDEIAYRLTISTETAKAHAKRIYRKLGVHSKAELRDALRSQSASTQAQRPAGASRAARDLRHEHTVSHAVALVADRQGRRRGDRVDAVDRAQRLQAPAREFERHRLASLRQHAEHVGHPRFAGKARPTRDQMARQRTGALDALERILRLSRAEALRPHETEALVGGDQPRRRCATQRQPPGARRIGDRQPSRSSAIDDLHEAARCLRQRAGCSLRHVEHGKEGGEPLAVRLLRVPSRRAPPSRRPRPGLLPARVPLRGARAEARAAPRGGR